ncbi:DUF6069 family protein [Specibacter sp. AOP5-B1-6]|uniref:DUF6069 family protein n=1 Tax=Specibacter sp. AOP5-B1-6 TaxID=3457653 RepID=UPI00402B2803
MSKTNANSPTARTDASGPSGPADYPGPATRRSAAVAAGVLAAVVLWLVAVPILGLDLVVGAGAQTQQVTLASVIAVPLLAGAAAWGLLAMLERRTEKALKFWRIIGWTFLAVSLLGPLGMGAAAGTLTVLALMHVFVGTILMLGLPLRRPGAPAYSGGNPDEDLS